MKKWKFEVPIYNTDISLYYGESYEEISKEFNKDFKKYGMELQIDEDPSMHGCEIFNDAVPHLAIIIKENKDKKGYPLGTLMHECNHAAFDILHQKGALVEWSNQEPFTYLAQFIYEKCLSKITNTKRTK